MGEVVTLRGWVTHLRSSGKVRFVVLRDGTGLAQGVLVKGRLPEADFAAFAKSVGEIGSLLGDYFAPVQGGRYSSPAVAAVLRWLAEAGYAGVGQSSWGPTGFVFVEDPLEAQALEGELTRRFAGGGTLAFHACAGRNRGAEIRRMAGKPLSAGAAARASTGW